MFLKNIFRAVTVLGFAALLAACGGSDGDTPAALVASGNTTTTLNPTTGPAVVQGLLQKSFEFPDGVSAFGTTAPPSSTSLVLSGAGTAPEFTLTSGGNTATGSLAFGSCRFSATTSSFSAGTPLAQGGKQIEIPCSLNIATAGLRADGSSFTVSVTLTLGGFTSRPLSLVITISAAGVVTINGFVVGNVPVVAVTGATGAGG